ncbi:N-acetyltransferase [Paenibacillus sp. N3.4]|uniref:GNAT family N-acetyltransferase n=1 Tax=Paenibacillus sp. N3.4 TaxID=2603222 RepID=UPI0011C93C94|nr:GNAT family N-acetyltransferase [Paenibacillus sp. N3.4]TXK83445.1 GNAT family N-acetyltransferase [Paenibacillus sp. N3.4]
MYSLRHVEAVDFPIICTFPQNEEELFYMFPKANFPLTPEQIENSLTTREKPTVVMDINKIVVAYANFYGREEGVCCWLGNVVVATNYRGTGASEYLIRSMMNIAKNELNMPKLQLVCHHTNPRALFFYTKLGFKPFGIRKIQREDGEIIAGIEMVIEL